MSKAKNPGGTVSEWGCITNLGGKAGPTNTGGKPANDKGETKSPNAGMKGK